MMHICRSSSVFSGGFEGRSHVATMQTAVPQPDDHWRGWLLGVQFNGQMTIGKEMSTHKSGRELRRCSVQRPESASLVRLETSTPMRPGSDLHWKRLGPPTSMQSGTGVRRGDICEVPCGEGRGQRPARARASPDFFCDH